MPMNLVPIKRELRAGMLSRRDELPAEMVRDWSEAIARRVAALPVFSAADTISTYLGFGREVQTTAIARDVLARGCRLALPRTDLAQRRLTLHEARSFDGLVPGPYGILEPPADWPEVDPAAVEIFLVPGLVFDSAGNRIGYGGGFYDSLLVLSEGWRVALAYSRQLVPHVPAAEHDMPMDLIVTECGVIDCGKGQAAGDHLRLRNMTFYGHHGAFPQEREHGIRLAVDVDLRMDLQWPGLTDDLGATVNYPAVYRLIERIQSGRQFTLFETMVEHIASAILEDFPAIAEVTVTARKFNPPVGGLLDAFEVEISRSRPAWMRPYGA